MVTEPTPVSMALVAHRPTNRRSSTLAKRLHRLTHAHPQDLITVCTQSGWLTPELEKAIKKVSSDGIICAKSGPALPTKKASIRHVNQEFGDEVQMDNGYFDVRGAKHIVLSMVDVGTTYAEGGLVEARNMEVSWECIECVWICSHCQSRAISGGDEFNNRQFTKRLQSREATFYPRPARRSNKIGIVERKHGTAKEFWNA